MEANLARRFPTPKGPRPKDFGTAAPYPFVPIGAWYILHNQPASSGWRVRYLRPNATVLFDSGNQSYGGNPFYRYATWWVYYNLNPDVGGVWTLELSVNGQVMVEAPFTVLDPGGLRTNRPPGGVVAAFEPAWPNTNSVVFCRLTVPLLIDLDYDLTRFRFQWRTNGVLFRHTTNAAYSDAVPAIAAAVPTLLSCTVTPYDGAAFGPTTTVQTLVGPPIQLNIAKVSPSQVSLHWPTSGVPYVIQAATNSPTSVWTLVTNAVVQASNENVSTVALAGATRYFRLRWP